LNDRNVEVEELKEDLQLLNQNWENKFKNRHCSELKPDGLCETCYDGFVLTNGECQFDKN